MTTMGVRRKFSRGATSAIVLIFFRFQCKWTFTKRFKSS